ncbi:MAG: trypsin-like peptidase domain-containing protein, partial [Oscillospiraceae bacterium]
MDDLDNQEIGENPETEENFSKSELENEFFEKTLAEENATAKENVEETLTAENNANEATTYAQTAAENPPKSEPNFYAEESFYDTNPLPKPVQPQYFPNQQGYYQNGQQFQQGGYIPYGQPPFNNVPNQQYQQPFNPNMANPQQNYCQAPPPPNPYDQYAQTPVQGDFCVNSAENPPKKKTKAAVIITSIAVCVVALLLLIAFISAMFLQVNKKGKPSENGAPQISISDKEKPEINETPAENGEYSPEQMAAILSKSVVAVYSYDDNSLTSNVKEASGIILSENGYILTNAHVTVGTAMQKVRFEDGTEYIAKVIGEDVPTDIAVIKIEPKTPLVPAEFGSSEGLLQGQQVCAMGNAGGFINSVTVGHVSSP